jgi:hypothetical protein
MCASIKKSPFPAQSPESKIRSSIKGADLRREFLALMPAGCQSHAATYGPSCGWLEVKGKKTGFFHIEQIQDRWWSRSPEGNAFFSKGVDHIVFTPKSDSVPKTPLS